MRATAIATCVLCCVLAAGCFEVEEELVLNADGSGTLELKGQIIAQAMAVLDEMAKVPGVESDIPLPITEQSIRTYYEGKGLTVTDLTLTDAPDGGKSVHLALHFADIRALNVAQLSGFTLTEADGGAIEFRAMPYDPSQMRGSDFFFQPEMGDFGLALAKFLWRGAKMRMRVSLPGKVLRTNGTQARDNTVTWDWTLDEMGYDAMRAGQMAVFDGAAITFALPVELPKPAGPMAAGAQVQAPVVPEAQAPGEFKVALHSLELTREMDLTTGEADGELEIQLAVSGPEGVEPASAEDALVERAVTDAGEVLVLNSWGGISMYTTQTWTPDGVVEEGRPRIRLSAPSAASTMLRELKGSFTLVCSSGTKEVRFAPLSAWIGRRLEHPDLGEIVVHLDSVSREGVVIRCNDEDAIKEVRFESEVGQPIEYNSWGSSGMGPMIRKNYDVDVSPEGAMILEVHTDRKKYTVPFSFQNVALP